jgi:hypothetical protein
MFTPVAIIDGVYITNSLATLGYTVPASTRTIVKEIVITNSHTVAVTVSIYFVPSAGSATNANRVMNEVSLAVAETKRFPFEKVMLAGATIHGVASVNSVVGCQISGWERT